MRTGSGARTRGRSAPLTLRHPRAVLAVAAVVLAALGVIGTGVESRLDPTTLDVPGTGSSRANAMLREHFGDSAPFAILLRGPAAGDRKTGPGADPRPARATRGSARSRPGTTATVEGLRPGPRRALILADFHVDMKKAVNETRAARSKQIARRGDPRAGAGRRRPATRRSRGRSRTNRSTPPSAAS